MEKGGRVYLGIWFQRTTLHLKEIYNFFKYCEGLDGLDKIKLREHWNKINVSDVVYHEETVYDYLEAKNKEIEFSMTEDGILLLSCPYNEKEDSAKKLEKYYFSVIGPAISYLFSMGAPIPKDLTIIEQAYPIYFIINHASKEKCSSFFDLYNDKFLSSFKDSKIEIYLGDKVAVLNVLHEKNEKELLEFLKNVVFFREFERQLNQYLQFHRKIWDKISLVRESKKLYFKDFSKVRAELLDYQKTISFGKARIAQMADIMKARDSILGKSLEKYTEDFPFSFDTLESTHKYITHLWDMTFEYVNSTLKLLETLYAENTQRELNALKIVTLINVITSFLSFSLELSGNQRILMIGIILTSSIAAYSVLRFMVFHRKFDLNKGLSEEMR